MSVAVIGGAVGVLVACGGGSDDAAPDVATGLAANVGNYEVACNGRTETAEGPITFIGSHQYASGSMNIAHSAETGKTTVEATRRAYESKGSDNSADTCAASSLISDVTVMGEIKELGTTKDYVDTKGRNVTTRIVEFTYTGVRFRHGSFTGSLPVPGVTKKIGYAFVDGQLHLTKGHQGTDGMGERLSEETAVKVAAAN